MNIRVKSLLWSQFAFFLFSFTGVIAKMISDTEFPSFTFVSLYGLEISLLFVYAIMWQQIIKSVDISIAYSSRAIAIIWTMFWSIVFFQEQLTINNFVGAGIIILGIVMVARDGE